jgi:hypothetical protein
MEDEKIKKFVTDLRTWSFVINVFLMSDKLISRHTILRKYGVYINGILSVIKATNSVVTLYSDRDKYKSNLIEISKQCKEAFNKLNLLEKYSIKTDMEKCNLNYNLLTKGSPFDDFYDMFSVDLRM